MIAKTIKGRSPGIREILHKASIDLIGATLNALVTDKEMPEGTDSWFSMPFDFDIVEKMIEEAAQIRIAGGFDADALLVFPVQAGPCPGKFDHLRK